MGKQSSGEHNLVTSVRLASNTQSKPTKPDFDSSFCTRRAGIYGYATSLQNTIWLQGMIPTSRRQSIPSCIRMRLEDGRGQSVVRLDNCEMTSMLQKTDDTRVGEMSGDYKSLLKTYYYLTAFELYYFSI